MSEKHESDLAFMLGRIQGDVKHILQAMTRNQSQFDRVDQRITAVERFMWKVAGIATAIPVILTLAGMFIL